MNLQLSSFASSIIYIASICLLPISANPDAQPIGSTVTLDCMKIHFLTIALVNCLQKSLFVYQPDGSFTGFQNESSGIIRFLGVRFADAPIGNLRWRAPISPPSTHLGNVDARQVRFPALIFFLLGCVFYATHSSQMHVSQHPRLQKQKEPQKTAYLAMYLFATCSHLYMHLLMLEHIIGLCTYEYFRPRQTSSHGLVSRSFPFLSFRL